MANSVRKARNTRTSGVSKPTPGVVSNNETQRREELANAYRQLGGTGNTDRMTIPTLEKNFTNLYEQNQANNSPVNVLTSSNPLTAIKNYRDNYNAQQAASSIYNDVKNRQTESALARTGQTQAARQNRNALVDQLSNSVVGMLTGTANFGSQKQNLTPEMQNAGITESDLRRYNDRQNNIEREETMRNLATSHPVLSTLGAVPSNLMESTDNNLKQLLNFVQGKPLEENRSNADIIRQTVGQNINIDSPEFLERLGLTDEKATNLGRIGYSGLNSIGDMALAGLVGGGGKVAASLMGLEKSSETMNDAIRRGLTPEQILAEGGLSGISTALTERLPFERFSSGGHVLGSMLAEGLQEGSEDILDTIFDEIVTRVGGNKDKSALHSEYNEYINAGYSPEDALNAVVGNYKQQLITDTVLGGITGGLMGAGSNFVRGRNMITGKPRTTETKSDIPTVNAVEDIPENIPTVTEGTADVDVRAAQTASDKVMQKINNGTATIEDLKEFRKVIRELETPGFEENPLSDDTFYAIQNIAKIVENAYAEKYSENSMQPTQNIPEVQQPEVKQNIPSLDSVIQRAESAVNTFLNGFNSNVLGIEEANDLRNELVALGRQNPEAQGQINNLWRNVVNTVRGNQTAQPSQNQGIQVYRGSNRSTNPLESNLVREKNVSDFISNLKENTPDLLPLSYYTESQDVARDYAKQDLDYYNLVGPEAYRILTGREDIPVEGEVKPYSINPQNVFDITELGEKVDSDTLYDYLRTKLGPEFEKAFPSTDYFNPNVDTADEGSMYAYQLLRNSGATNTGDTGTRFYNLLRKLGYDAVRYAEQGTNQYAVFPNESEQQTTQPEASRRDLIQQGRDTRNLINLAEQYKAKLSSFGNKSFNSQIDNAITALRNGDPNAAENLNTLLAQIDERMNGETVGVSERALNKDMYDQMKNVTDGRVIRISPETLRAMDMSVTELNDKISTGTGRLRFKVSGGTPIDSVYQEMYDLAGGMLPEPRSMGESDMVNAIVNYMTDAKSGKNNVVNESSWNDVPLEETRNEAIVDLQNKADEFLDRILDGKLTNRKDINNAFNELENLGAELNKKSPALGAAAADVINETRKIYKDNLLDADIREAKTPQDINKALHKINLDFFGNGEEEADTDYVNKAQTGNFKESDVYNNTGKNSGIMTDREIEQHEKDNDMLYESIDEKSSMDQAYKSLKERGKTPERERLLKTDDWTNSDVDEAFILWQIAVNEATAIDERGGDSSKAWEEAAKFFRKIKEIGSGKGQGLQAFAKWSRNNTAEGLLHHASRVIKTAKDGQRAATNNWDSQVAKLTKDAHEMDADFMKEFLTEAKKIEGLDLNSREARHIMANLGRMINTQMPPNLAEKITTLLMDNMLGNIRTLITRNAGGNVGFNLMEEFLRKPLSALIDSRLASARGTNRTISGLTREGWNAWKEGFKEGFKQEIYDFQNDIQSARSGENTLENATANNRDVFNNKLLAKYNKLVKTGLSIGDRPFYEATYKQSLVEYNKLYNEGKIRGLDGKPLPREKFNELAELHAKLNALAAVYQDDSAMAEAFVGMKKAISKMSEGLVGSDILSQFSMPFVKTPANIIERSIEYSPLGLAKNIVQTLREVKSDRLDFNQERFATELSRNIIGSGLFAIGLMMANGGALTGAYSDDKDMKQAQKEAGMQEFALHTGMGDFDLSWIPVIGNNLVSAASAFDSYNRPDVEGGQALGNGITAGVRSQFDTSALQGLQRLVGGSGSGYNSDTDIVTNAKNTLLSGGTQFVPSLFRQAAAFLDPNQRQLAGPNENDYYLNSVLNAIPGLRETLQPKIGRTGEELEQNPGQGTFGKFLTNFISPANWTQGVNDPVRDEAMRLFESTGNNIAFQPSVSMKELKTEDHVPTAEEFTEYQRNAYTAMNQIAQQIIGSDYYANMTDGEKETTLDGIYKAVKAVEKANILGTDKSTLSGASKAYDEGGADGLVDYILARSYLNQLGASNNPENRETVLGMLENGEMEQTLALSNELQQAGLQGNLNETYKYEHASQYIPSLTPTDFAQTFTAIDQQPQGTSGHGSISQGEILDYLNQNPSAYSDEDAMQLWNAYGTGTWVYIPVLNSDGTWHKKKV